MSDDSVNAACYDARGTAAFDAAGEDVTLIDWMLPLTPEQRLRTLFDSASTALVLMSSAKSDLVSAVPIRARPWSPA
jgi:hypothetical protein